MKTTEVDLSKIHLNDENPRKITDSKFRKLVDSLLALPKMLNIRPVVVDGEMTALGGNMRLRALSSIAGMDEDELRARVISIPDVEQKTQAEIDALVGMWLKWRDKPTVCIIEAGDLTKDEAKEFIIKDNAAFGDWDYDALANNGWESEELDRWGMTTPWNENLLSEDYGNVTSGGEIDVAENDNVDIKFSFEPEVWDQVYMYLTQIAETKEAALLKLMEGDYGL